MMPFPGPIYFDIIWLISFLSQIIKSVIGSRKDILVDRLIGLRAVVLLAIVAC